MTRLVLMLLCTTPHAVTEKNGMRLLLSPTGAHTMSPLDGGATGRYYDWGELVGYQRPNAKRVVLLGLGGGEMLRAARRSLPDAELVGVEIDPDIAKVAVKDFGVERFGVQVVVGDAASYVRDLEKLRADVIMVDVFEDTLLPAYFRTPGFFEECYRVVGREGAVLMNVWPEGLAPAVAKSMRRGGFTRVVAIRVGHGNALLWAGPLENPAPAWMRLEERYVP